MPQPNTAPRRAREQATAYRSVFAPMTLELDDGTTMDIPPHPNLRLLDDDRQEAYEELLFEMESYDREPDVFIPEQRLDGGVVLPSETRRGNLIYPYRKTIDGVTQLVKPPHSVRTVQVALGDADWERLKAGGRNASDVWKIWNDQWLRVADRSDADPKSNGSPVPVAPVSG